MIDNPKNADNLDPKVPSEEESEIIDNHEDFIDDENQITDIDPLAELRQDMFEEEQQPEPNRPDLLQRMTGTLSSRKVPTRPRPATNGEPIFGIRTNRHMPPPEPSLRKTQAPNEEIHDEFLEKRLRTVPSGTSNDETEPEALTDAPIHIEGDPKAEGGLFTKVSSDPESSHAFYTENRGRRRMDPLWDNVDEEVEENIEPIPVKSSETLSRPVDERKMLGTGSERQYQVNKYLSYNPNRNLFDRFQNLSAVEKILLIVLILAVIIVASLIIFLYISSRQPILPQAQPLVSATQFPDQISSEKIPIPSALKLTGGWSFQLNQGALKDGKWIPTSNEWLTGTEIRRVIALPWNKQLEAVITSLEPTNLIDLYMNNGDILSYKVDSVSQVSLSDSSIMYDTRPSLAIILIKPDSTLRWVVVAYP